MSGRDFEAERQAEEGVDAPAVRGAPTGKKGEPIYVPFFGTTTSCDVVDGRFFSGAMSAACLTFGGRKPPPGAEAAMRHLLGYVEYIVKSWPKDPPDEPEKPGKRRGKKGS
jgi:hypothetical protein